MPKNWPVKRKGTTFVVRPNFNPNKGLPVLIILRDILKVAQDRREVQKIIHSKQVLLNNKSVRDDKNNVLLFDVLTIVPTNKSYRMSLSNKGKFKIVDVDVSEAGKKIAKISDKKILKGKI
jgi:small subunit ribosomal protein S4e